MTTTLYYAVNADGKDLLFTKEPQRHDGFKVWCGDTSGRLFSLLQYMKDMGFEFPDRTFKDDPIPIKVTFDYA